MWRDSVVRIQAQHRRTAWNSAIWWKEGGNSKSSTSWQRRVLGVAGMRCAGELATLFKQPIPRTCLAILRGRHGPVRRSVPSCNTVVSLWFRTRAARPIRVLCSLAVTWSPQKFRAFDSGDMLATASATSTPTLTAIHVSFLHIPHSKTLLVWPLRPASLC